MQHTIPRLTITVLAVTLVALLSAGCSREAAPAPDFAQPEPYEVLVEPQQLELEAGGIGMLQAQVNDTRGQPIGGATVQFRSENPDLVRVTDQGRVTAVGGTGRAVVIATSGPRERRVPVQIKPGPPQRLEKVQGNPQNAIAGAAFADPVVVRAVDAFGNPIAEVALTLEISGDEPMRLAAITGPDGAASFALPAVTEAGLLAAVVSSDRDSNLATAIELTVLPAPPTKLVPIEMPIESLGTASADDMEIAFEVQDEFGNPVPGVSVSMVAGDRSGQTVPAQAKSAQDGSVRTRWQIKDAAASTLTLTASLDDASDVRYVVTISPPGTESQTGKKVADVKK